MKKTGSGIKIVTLTRKVMEEIVGLLVDLDRACIRELGEGFSTFPWEEENYLRDLKGKWSLSQAAFGPDGSLAGAWVASSTVPLVCHTHRVIVAALFRGQGVAGSLFQACTDAAREKGLRLMTIEASCKNREALRFYKKEGFSPMSAVQIAGYLKARGRVARVMADRLEEEDKSRYFVLQKGL